MNLNLIPSFLKILQTVTSYSPIDGRPIASVREVNDLDNILELKILHIRYAVVI